MGGRLLSFVLFIWVARRLSPPEFGWYIFGLSAGFVVAQLADLGLQTVLSREIAVHDLGARSLVPLALGLKIPLSGIVLLLLLLIAAAVEREARAAILLLGVVQLLQTYLEFAGHIFRGQQRLRLEAAYLFVARLLTALLVWTAVFSGGGLLSIAAAHLAAMLVALIVPYTRLFREGWLRPLVASIRQPSKDLLRTATPLGLAIFASIAYTRLAILLLQPLAGETAVAHFGIALRLIEPLQLLPAALMAAVFPVFSRAWHVDRHQARRLGWMVSTLLAGAAVMLAVMLYFSAPRLVPWLFGLEFGPSVPVVQLLGFTTIPAFVNYSLTHYLIARDQQRWITFLNLGMLLLHLGLCLGLIPIWGIWAPAVAMLIAETFLLAGCLLTLRFRPAPGQSKSKIRNDDAGGILAGVKQRAFME